MSDSLRISYAFRFSKGNPVEIDLQIDPETLQCTGWQTVSAPVWVNLDFEQCGNCPLDPSKQPYCPLALRLLQVVQSFSKRSPTDDVALTVRTLERTFDSATNLQDALRSLVGVIMPCSGCPHLAAFRPMARFHLPVGSLAETVYRSTSMYMLAQFFVAKHGGQPDLNMEGLKQIYGRIHEVNEGISRRLAHASMTDAAAKSLQKLDLFTTSIPKSIEQHLADFEGYFVAFTNPAALL